MIRGLISFYFEQFITVTQFGAAWTDNKNKFKITFDKASLKLAINFFFIVLVVCPFEKSLVFPWVLTQHLL